MAAGGGHGLDGVDDGVDDGTDFFGGFDAGFAGEDEGGRGFAGEQGLDHPMGERFCLFWGEAEELFEAAVEFRFNRVWEKVGV